MSNQSSPTQKDAGAGGCRTNGPGVDALVRRCGLIDIDRPETWPAALCIVYRGDSESREVHTGNARIVAEDMLALATLLSEYKERAESAEAQLARVDAKLEAAMKERGLSI